jgi:UPF0042 nucleotide-binding protein
VREVKNRRESPNTDIVIVSGLSGAGKSLALRTLEDFGYFCVDNLPPALMPTFMSLCAGLKEPMQKLAMVVDIRGGEFFEDLDDALLTLNEQGTRPLILFLDADDDALVRRYKETRRRHPLSPQGSILEGIRAERDLLSNIKTRANMIIDTSDLSISEFRKQLTEVFSKNVKAGRLLITVVTFGFKWGLPMDADLVFDVRFLPNPHYVNDLRPLSGLDLRVAQYVFKSRPATLFFSHLKRFVDFLLPQYIDEGKTHLTIAIGCTGGRHRSVAVAEALKAHLESKEHTVIVEHRDIERNIKNNTGGPDQ